MPANFFLRCLWRSLLLAALQACNTKAYAPAPIRWGVPDSRLFLAPKFLPSGAIVPKGAISQPQRLTIWDQHVQPSTNDMPHFTISPDKTISWAGRCVEASGQSSGDAVRINRCDGGPTQLWTVLPWGRNSRIQLKDSSLCIDAIHQEGGWHGAPIVLRSCDNENREFWNLANPIPHPRGTPSQDFPVRSALVRPAMISFFVLAMLLPLGFGTVVWRWRKNTGAVATRQGGLPLCMDQDGLALTMPAASQQNNHEEIVPAVMVAAPAQDKPRNGNAQSDARSASMDDSSNDESSGKLNVIDFRGTDEELHSEVVNLDGDAGDSSSSDDDLDLDLVPIDYMGDVDPNQSGFGRPVYRIYSSVVERWKQAERKERDKENKNGIPGRIRKVLSRSLKRAMRKRRNIGKTMTSSLIDEKGFLMKPGSDDDLPEEVELVVQHLKDRLGGQPFYLQITDSDDEDERQDGGKGKGDLSAQKRAGLVSLRNFNLKPQEVFEYLNRYVIQQYDAKKVLAVALCDHYNHVRRQLGAPDMEQQDYAKPNILLLGPTGVGKTYLMKTIARLIGVPFVKGDATKFTETGIVGQNAEDMVRDLVAAADGNTELAQYGIIYLDEVDKIAGGGDHGDSAVPSRTSLTRGVQNNFLKLLEDTDVTLEPEGGLGAALGGVMGGRMGPSKPKVINTRNILFIFSGAFVGLDAEIKRRKETRSLGFGIDADRESIDGPPKAASYLRYAETKDLVAAGLEPEFVGRVPVRVALEALTAENLKEILTKSEGSVLNQFIADFEGYGIDMKATDDALTQVAKLADKEGTGARGLVTVLERTLREHKFVLPSSSIKKFELDAATVQSPTDGLTALITSMTAEDELNVRMDDLKRWEQHLMQEVAPLEPSITDEAMNCLLQLSILSSEGAYWFAMRRFEDLPALLKQIAETTGKQQVSIDLKWAQEPQEQFFKWRQIVENAKKYETLVNESPEPVQKA